jgi:hypothetical protein
MEAIKYEKNKKWLIVRYEIAVVSIIVVITVVVIVAVLIVAVVML